MPPYVYKPLPDSHIRLLTLYPASKSGEIQISLSTIPFADEGTSVVYKALSYAWGDPSKTSTVVVRRRRIFEGVRTAMSHLSLKSHKTPSTTASEIRQVEAQKSTIERQPLSATGGGSITIGVTENLAAALLHLRHEKRSRVFWIDAICIDQQNLEEKGKQIWKMGDIFRRAKGVIVWLGASSDDSAKAMRVLEHLGQQVDYDTETRQLHPSTNQETSCRDWANISTVLPYDDDTWKAISSLLSRSWFERLWVLQEIKLADQDQAIIKCGDISIPWRDFQNSVGALDGRIFGHAQGETDLIVAVSARLGRMVELKCSNSLVFHLQRTREMVCTDPHDRIYAILGLCSDGPDLSIRADYSLSISKLFTQTAMSCALSQRSLHGILMACDAQTWSSGLPTWVPNWTRPLQYRYDNLPCVGSSSRGYFTFTEDMLVNVYGVCCGTVKECHSLETTHLLLKDTASTIQTIAQSFPETAIPSLSNMLVSGYTEERYDDLILPSIEDVIHVVSFLRNLDSAPLLERTPSNDQVLDVAHMFLKGRKIFRTEEGNIGLGPTLTLSGDKIFAIMSCPKLLVLRPSSHGQFRIVGICALNGFINLETWLGPLPLDHQVGYSDTGEHSHHMRFVNSETKKKSPIDPRLGGDLDGWTSDERDDDGDVVWRNIETGDPKYCDPRLEDVEFMRKRGVKVEDIVIE